MPPDNSHKERDSNDNQEKKKSTGKRSVAFSIPENEKEEDKNDEVQKDDKERKKINKAIKSGRRYSEAEKAFLSRVNVSKGKEKSEEEAQRNSLQTCCRYAFDPTGDLLYYWLAVVSIAVSYNLWMIIFRVAFPEVSEGKNQIWWMAADYSCDFVYFLDFIVSARTGFLENGIMQSDIQKLRFHYIKTYRFYLDVSSLLPFDLLYLYLGYEPWLRANRLIKAHRFWYFLDRTESRTSWPNVFRLASLIHSIIVIIHWNACIYFIVSRAIGFGVDNWVYPSKIGHYVLNGTDALISRKYLHSFYWSTMTLTTIGEGTSPHSNIEYVFVTADFLVGVLLFATIVGNVGSIITNVNMPRLNFQNKMDSTKAYMRFHKVPRHLQERVIKWFDYLWTHKKHTDEENILGSLPDKLKAEIAIHVHLDSLRRVTIFHDCEAGFLCELVLRLRPQLFSPGDYVCRKGEVGKEMYIVNRGRLEVVSEDGRTVFVVLESGSYFGEISILNMGASGNRRTASVRSVGYSDLFCLSKTDLMEVLKEYPLVKKKLEEIAREKLEKDKTRASAQRTTILSHSQDELCEEEKNDPATLRNEINRLQNANIQLVKSMREQKEELQQRVITLESVISKLLEDKEINCT